jgi:hypothetical protein
MDGATTLSEAATRLRKRANRLEGLESAGWQLEQPVKDDYGFIKERKEAVVMRSYGRRIETEADIQAALDWAVEHEQLCECVTREDTEAWMRDRLEYERDPVRYEVLRLPGPNAVHDGREVMYIGDLDEALAKGMIDQILHRR